MCARLIPNTRLSKAGTVTRKALFKRFSSSTSTSPTTTITVKATPSKDHLHCSLPQDILPKGYLLTGIHAGVKKIRPGAPPPLDLAVVLSTSSRPTSAAACFTLNTFRAAPVVVSRDVLLQSGGRARAIVVNSGCANAVTGKQGTEDAWSMVRAGDALLRSHGVSSDGTNETLVMSTGVIGVNLPISKILTAIQAQSSPSSPSYALSSTPSAYDAAARAFMTTDTFPKLRARSFTLKGDTYRMAGMDKGAGMIHPRMAGPDAVGGLHATLLGLILTDAPVSPRSLQSALTYAVDRSFNSISIDGDMSTNDTIIALANGAGAGVERSTTIEDIDEETDPDAYCVFRDELTDFAIDLAKLVVRDGEGATKFVEVCVEVCALIIHGTYTNANRNNRTQHRTPTHTASHPPSPRQHSSKPPYTAKTPSKSFITLTAHNTLLMDGLSNTLAGAASFHPQARHP